MSIMDTAHRSTGLPSSGVLGGLTQRFARYKTYRRTLDELHALSHRELADLGIHRSQIRGIAYRAAYDG